MGYYVKHLTECLTVDRSGINIISLLPSKMLMNQCIIFFGYKQLTLTNLIRKKKNVWRMWESRARQLLLEWLNANKTENVYVPPVRGSFWPKGQVTAPGISSLGFWRIGTCILIYGHYQNFPQWERGESQEENGVQLGKEKWMPGRQKDKTYPLEPV